VISVLVVDDSVVVRRLIQDALSGEPDITVVGTASNGRLAVGRVEQLKPDVVTMDIEMPEMNGIEAVRELRKRQHRVPVIMFSTLSSSGASATLDALAAGATDYVTKPANTGSVQASIEAVRTQLVPKILGLGGKGRRTAAPVAAPSTPVRTRPQVDPRPTSTAFKTTALVAPNPNAKIDVIAVGCSTGGPDALATVLGSIPASLPVPIVVVQHMPPLFTKMFAERLDRTQAVTVHEATDGVKLLPGNVYIAPGDKHMMVVRQGVDVLTKLTDEPPENSCRPAVDVLFRSVAKTYGASTLATILTGMGHDGRAGAAVLRGLGAELIAQDEATSVVWGMPGAVVEAGLATSVLPLSRIGAQLATRANVGRTQPKLAVSR